MVIAYRLHEREYNWYIYIYIYIQRINTRKTYYLASSTMIMTWVIEYWTGYVAIKYFDGQVFFESIYNTIWVGDDIKQKLDPW